MVGEAVADWLPVVLADDVILTETELDEPLATDVVVDAPPSVGAGAGAGVVEVLSSLGRSGRSRAIATRRTKDRQSSSQRLLQRRAISSRRLLSGE